MDFTFLMFVLSAGFLIGSYFLYWHIESVISSQCEKNMRGMETLCNGLRASLQEDFNAVRESLEKCRVSCSTLKSDIDALKAKLEEPKVFKPARKTTMKLKEKISPGHDE